MRATRLETTLFFSLASIGAIALTARHVLQENFVYFWDTATHWGRYRSLGETFVSSKDDIARAVCREIHDNSTNCPWIQSTHQVDKRDGFPKGTLAFKNPDFLLKSCPKHSGEVEVRILADEVPVISRYVNFKNEIPFELDIRSVSKLKLKVTSGRHGAICDWFELKNIELN